jgi:hypothetical protein
MQEFGRFGPAVRVKHQADKVGADTIHLTRGGNQIYYAPNVFGVGGTWEQLALRRAFSSSEIWSAFSARTASAPTLSACRL